MLNCAFVVPIHKTAFVPPNSKLFAYATINAISHHTTTNIYLTVQPTYTGMWCYLVATTSLVIANALMYMNLYVDSITVPKFAADVVIPVTQMVGGSMLLVGSIIYVIWSA